MPAEVRDGVIERDGGMCRRCSTPEDPVAGQEAHHRRGRGMGGTKIDPHGYARIVWVCGDCHRWAEKERAEAYASGWAIRRSDSRADCEIPMVRPDGVRVWLDEYGGAYLQDPLEGGADVSQA